MLFDLYDGYRTTSKAYAERGKPLQHWSVTSRQAGVVCEALLPYLRIKRLQAENAIEVCRLAARRSKSFPIPTIVPGEPMVTMAEAARQLGKSYDVVHQAVRKGTGSVPFVRLGPRKVLIPESFLPIWSSRPRSPARPAEVSEALEACHLRAKELNRAGI